jgi:predicted lipoprotein with Yx(FWY)xxD motif
MIKGERVVTYYGDPLYRFRGDRKPGQTRGEGKADGNGGWYLISKIGQPVSPGGYP